MKIGELAKTLGTTPEAVRFYEREGLLPGPAGRVLDLADKWESIRVVFGI
ncbi:MAG TPA: MerR family DNA-binding transcriptional regulator [Candidatus Limnocylindrales bacterium]|nr:MerR family DNA-binding transcriptional regulator [Candidatus Limnocylindrales bacterium]